MWIWLLILRFNLFFFFQVEIWRNSDAICQFREIFVFLCFPCVDIFPVNKYQAGSFKISFFFGAYKRNDFVHSILYILILKKGS